MTIFELTTSSTETICNDLALYKTYQNNSENNHQDLPDEAIIEGAIQSITEAIMIMMSDTNLEDDLDNNDCTLNSSNSTTIKEHDDNEGRGGNNHGKRSLSRKNQAGNKRSQ